jgi:hypothetical protein
MRRQVPLVITFFTGLLMIVGFFVPHRPVGNIQETFLGWFAVVTGFTMILGVESLVHLHARKVARRSEGWRHSLLLLCGVFLTLYLGVESWIRHGSIVAIGSSFMYLFEHVIVPLQATMFALLAFFIASAAYRAFRARTVDATLLLVAAAVVMLGRLPIGGLIWKGLPGVSDWIMEIPQMAAKRGIMIGTYLGAAAMSLRIILGIERTYLS